MIQSILSLPKHILAVLVIVLGILFFVLQDPPQTVCDIQEASYKDQNQSLLFEQKSSSTKSSRINTNIRSCLDNNTPGACYDLFQNVRELIHSFKVIHSECYTQIIQIPQVKQAFQTVYRLFVTISFNDGDEGNAPQPLRWLTFNDVTLFCHLRRQIELLLGLEFANNLDKTIYEQSSLELSFSQFSRFSILSQDCQQYP